MKTMSNDYPKQDAWGRKRTPYAVNCQGPWDLGGGLAHGLVYLTKEEYDEQISAPDKTWRCPICRYDAIWSDNNYEEFEE